MLSPKIEEAFNKQINAEFYSSYLYLSMAAYFEWRSLPGMAHWMRLQVDEENAHGTKFYDFIHERNGRVKLAAIDAPEVEWDSPLAAFEAALAHEQKVTGLINDLVNLAMAEKDHAAANFLQWFVDEQVEEEANAAEVVDMLKLAGEKGTALFMIDRQLGQRGS